MRSFDHFACIDWSGAATRWQPGIAVAQCEAVSSAPRLIPSPERHWNRSAILDWLLQQAEARRNILIGLDLSIALPFADRQSYFPGWEASPPDAKALWRSVDALSSHDDYLSAQSFLQHPEIARHFRQHRNKGDLFGEGRGRLRKCEYNGQALIEGINPYSCFNLVGAAQVGKSSLTGMRVLHRLNSAIPIWPFDPLPASGPVIVEIYTSIAAQASGVLAKGRSKITDPQLLDTALDRFSSKPHSPLYSRLSDHAADALLTAAWLRTHADQKDYWQPAKLKPEIAKTEGWTFGVV
ncbi:MAG: hypothetical protein IPL18_01560 [Sphingomonadales bacterium]|nr:hypothetical protein [Sphingomonadales bacterium]